ncbi:MAG TPA: hypothetical protein VFV10_04545 [Gammaproteobacteria bacterium]|nr:hypothetical protein [Gammaproteobacteria bacterium]
MQATKKGIEINREELWALLAFTGDGEQYACVHFRVNGSAKLEAAATDGKRSVECVGPAEGAAPGEWAIDADFLELCRNACDAPEKSILIRLSSAGIRDAHVVDEQGEMIAPIGWHRAASSSQVTMSDVIVGLQVPSDAKHMGSWCAIDPAAVLRGLSRVRVAADDCPITLYPGPNPTAPMHFECRSEHGHWKGAIVPEKVIGPGSEADEPPQPDEGAPGRADRQTRLDLEDRANAPKDGARDERDDDDPIIDDAEAARIKAEQKGAHGLTTNLAPPKKGGRGKRKKAGG